MKKLFLIGIAALSVLSASAAAEPDPKWEYVEKDQTFHLGINHGGRLNLYIERWKSERRRCGNSWSLPVSVYISDGICAKGADLLRYKWDARISSRAECGRYLNWIVN